jgi:hypothetical protein
VFESFFGIAPAQDGKFLTGEHFRHFGAQTVVGQGSAFGIFVNLLTFGRYQPGNIQHCGVGTRGSFRYGAAGNIAAYRFHRNLIDRRAGLSGLDNVE